MFLIIRFIIEALKLNWFESVVSDFEKLIERMFEKFDDVDLCFSPIEFSVDKIKDTCESTA